MVFKKSNYLFFLFLYFVLSFIFFLPFSSYQSISFCFRWFRFISLISFRFALYRYPHFHPYFYNICMHIFKSCRLPGFCLIQEIKQLFNGCGCNRPNYLSFGVGNDQVFYCIRPLASCNRTLSHFQHLRTNRLVYCIHTH